MEWFVWMDTAYYPYVVNEHVKGEDGIYRYVPIVADSAEEAAAAKCSAPGRDEMIFVAPWDQVTVFRGPDTVYPVNPSSGGYTAVVTVEAGSLRPTSG